MTAHTFESIVGSLAERNNRRIAEADPSPIVRDTSVLAWASRLRKAWPIIRDEWDRASARGYRLPTIEAILSESQGNEGRWSAGMLVVRCPTSIGSSVPVSHVAAQFPRTTKLLLELPQIRTAMFSVLDADAVLPTHIGPNAGVLRYHLGVDCPPGATLTVANRNGIESVLTYHNGEDILFSDITPHSATNRATRPRVTLFCEVTRPLHGRVALENELMQRIFSFDPRYRLAAARAADLALQLNPSVATSVRADR